jgi:hypothetical protein
LSAGRCQSTDSSSACRGLLKETMLAAWRGLEQYEERASVRAWLDRIATQPLAGRPASEPAPAEDLQRMTEMLEPTCIGEPIWVKPYPHILVEPSAPTKLAASPKSDRRCQLRAPEAASASSPNREHDAGLLMRANRGRHPRWRTPLRRVRIVGGRGCRCPGSVRAHSAGRPWPPGDPLAHARSVPLKHETSTRSA